MLEKHWNLQKHWDYKLAEQVLDFMDFELLVSKNEDNETILKLHDLQGRNLANIESEEFYTIDEVMGRLDGAYATDYFETDLCERFEDDLGEWQTWEDIVNTLLALPEDKINHYLWDINVLGLFSGMWE